MQFYVHHNGQKMGPYSPEQVRSLLLAGTFQSTDLAWHDGAPGWATLASYPVIVGPSPSAGYNPWALRPGTIAPSTASETSGLAITSLVLGILTFFSAGLTGIPAVICGHLSLSQIKKSDGRISGSGLATAGLITGYFGFLLIMMGVVLPVFLSVGNRAQATKCLSQAKQIYLGCKTYSVDHEGKYPPTLDDLVPKYLPDRHLFVCPMTKDATSMGYEYFAVNETDPPTTVILESRATTRDHKRVIVTLDGTATLKRDK